jgi:hypothetical protein
MKPKNTPGEIVRLVVTALAVGVGAFLLSLLFWPIDPGSGGWLIERYEALSLDPLQRSPYSHRILAPVLAHVLHLDGERFRLLTLGCSVFLLAGVFAYCRWNGVTEVGSAAVAVAIAISRTVGNSSVKPGLTDTLTYLLLLGTLVAAGRPYLFWVLFALNLSNHEQIAFLLPWLLLMRHASGGLRIRRDVGIGVLIFAGYAGMRAVLGSGVVKLHVAYTMRPFVDYVVEYLIVWWFFLTSFGLLLTCLLAYASRGRFQRTSVLLCLAGAAAPYAIAWDPPRYIHMAFVVVLIASVKFLTDRQRLGWYVAILLGNVLIYRASNAIMERAIASLATACQGVADPARCVHLGTTSVTVPSLVVLPLLWWLSRRIAAPADADA